MANKKSLITVSFLTRLKETLTNTQPVFCKRVRRSTFSFTLRAAETKFVRH